MEVIKLIWFLFAIYSSIQKHYNVEILSTIDFQFVIQSIHYWNFQKMSTKFNMFSKLKQNVETSLHF